LRSFDKVTPTAFWKTTSNPSTGVLRADRYRAVPTLAASPSPRTAVVRNAGEPIVPPDLAGAFDVPATAVELAGVSSRFSLAGSVGCLGGTTTASSALSLGIG
jgi:hypothetical protein